ncbi:MAG: hypothetical protein PUA56_05955 [Bacillales bacterium]|nr:hypothetical protein [Bacillales bacterium]
MQKMMMCLMLGVGMGVIGYKMMNKKESSCICEEDSEEKCCHTSKQSVIDKAKTKIELVLEELETIDLSEVKTKTKETIDSIKRTLNSIKI